MTVSDHKLIVIYFKISIHFKRKNNNQINYVYVYFGGLTPALQLTK